MDKRTRERMRIRELNRISTRPERAARRAALVKKRKEEYLAAERAHLRNAIMVARGNVTEAARLLEMSQSTLQHKIRRQHPSVGEYADKLRSKPSSKRRADKRLTENALRASWNRHRTISDVAREFDMPRSTMRLKLIESGIYRPRKPARARKESEPSKMSTEELKELYASASSISELAVRLGIHYATAYRLMVRRGIHKPTAQPRTPKG